MSAMTTFEGTVLFKASLKSSSTSHWVADNRQWSLSWPVLVWSRFSLDCPLVNQAIVGFWPSFSYKPGQLYSSL